MKKERLLKDGITFFACMLMFITSFSNNEVISRAYSSAKAFLFNVSSQIQSNGRIIFKNANGEIIADIDSDEIKANRGKIKQYATQLGWEGEDSKIFCYSVGDNIYMVTGTHTILTDDMSYEDKIKIINSEMNKEDSVTISSGEINLTSSGNSTWMRMK